MFIGNDPGVSGAIAGINSKGEILGVVRLHKSYERIAKEFKALLSLADEEPRALIEKVSSRSGQGVKSVFTFGRSYGAGEMLLASCGVPYEFATPQKWMRALGCLTGGDKKVTQRFALQIWPNANITQKDADALLLAEYLRRTSTKEG